MKISDIEVTLIDHMGSDLSVVNAARVSFHKTSEWEWNLQPEFRGSEDMVEKASLSDKDTKLINYLAKHKHFSPFNHAFMTFRIKAPIFVARQLVKHKFMPWNEVSRRYVDEEPEFYFPEYWRAKAENVKQGSSNTEFISTIQRSTKDGKEQVWDSPVDFVTTRYCEHAVSIYSDMLLSGVSPEQARMILPQNMMTEWMWSGTLGAYADMLKLRLDPHTQYESRIVAEKVVERVRELFPVSINALLENK